MVLVWSNSSVGSFTALGKGTLVRTGAHYNSPRNPKVCCRALAP